MSPGRSRSEALCQKGGALMRCKHSPCKTYLWSLGLQRMWQLVAVLEHGPVE